MNSKIKKLDNGLFVMVDDTHLSRWVEASGQLDHERGFLDTLKQHFPLGGTVIDCGTSIGDHTVYYASCVGPTGKVLGFEANPDVFECCALNLAIYPWAKIYNIGLSDDYGESGIALDPNVGASHLVNEGRGIMLAPLDSYIEEIDRCDFIKVDIEGFEVKFLKGARALIAKFKPAMLMEINAGALDRQGFSPDSVYYELANMGYKWTTVQGKAGTPMYEILATPAKKPLTGKEIL